MREQKEEIRYEDAAEQATVTGWECKKCKRFWGDSEHMARYCCCTSMPCECGGRLDKYWTICDACRAKQAIEKWYAKPAVEWDGEYPIAIWDDDKYFFDEDELMEYLDELDWDIESEPNETVTADRLATLQLTSCCPNNGQEFEMSEFLQDDLGEDQELDDKEINKIVNDWIAAHAPLSWSATGERLCIASIKKRLGFQSCT